MRVGAAEPAVLGSLGLRWSFPSHPNWLKLMLQLDGSGDLVPPFFP